MPENKSLNEKKSPKEILQEKIAIFNGKKAPLPNKNGQIAFDAKTESALDIVLMLEKATSEEATRLKKEYLFYLSLLPISPKIDPDNPDYQQLAALRSQPIRKKIGYTDATLAPALKEFWEIISRASTKGNGSANFANISAEEFKNALTSLEKAISNHCLYITELDRCRFELLPKFIALFLATKPPHLTDLDPTHVLQIIHLISFSDKKPSFYTGFDTEIPKLKFFTMFKNFLNTSKVNLLEDRLNIISDIGRLIMDDERGYWSTIFLSNLQENQLYIQKGKFIKLTKRNDTQGFATELVDTTKSVSHGKEGWELLTFTPEGKFLIHPEISDSTKEKNSTNESLPQSEFIDQENHKTTFVIKDQRIFAVYEVMGNRVEDPVEMIASSDKYVWNLENNKYVKIDEYTPGNYSFFHNNNGVLQLNEAPTFKVINGKIVGCGFRIIHATNGIESNEKFLEWKNQCAKGDLAFVYSPTANTWTGYLADNEKNLIEASIEINSPTGKELQRQLEEFEKQKDIRSFDTSSLFGALFKEEKPLFANFPLIDASDFLLRYAVTQNGRLIFKSELAAVHHSSLVNFGCAQGGFEVNIIKGILKHINHHSGHFLTRSLTLKNFLDVLKKLGVNLSETMVHPRSRKKLKTNQKNDLSEREKDRFESLEGCHEIDVETFEALMDNPITPLLKILNDKMSFYSGQEINLISDTNDPVVFIKKINQFINKYASSQNIVIKHFINLFGFLKDYQNDDDPYTEISDIMLDIADDKANPLLFCYYKLAKLFAEYKTLCDFHQIPFSKKFPDIFHCDSKKIELIIKEIENINSNYKDKDVTTQVGKMLDKMKTYFYADLLFSPLTFAKDDVLVESLRLACLQYLIDNDVVIDKKKGFTRVTNLLSQLHDNPNYKFSDVAMQLKKLKKSYYLTPKPSSLITLMCNSLTNTLKSEETNLMQQSQIESFLKILNSDSDKEPENLPSFELQDFPAQNSSHTASN